MRKTIALVSSFFWCAILWSQVSEYQILSEVISVDSFGLLKEISKSNRQLIYVGNKLFQSNNEEGPKDYFPDLDLTTVDYLEYFRLQKKVKKISPVIFIDRILIESNIITYNVKGARYEYTRNKRDCFFVFSEFLISYKYNCTNGEWERYAIKSFNE